MVLFILGAHPRLHGKDTEPLCSRPEVQEVLHPLPEGLLWRRQRSVAVPGRSPEAVPEANPPPHRPEC